MTSEELRLKEDKAKGAHWRRWGPYLSERQWGTVREDYSAHGKAWKYFPHDHARSRAYRWGEDGIGGISDNHQRLCFALTVWNGEDAILKERIFGLNGHEGNHGEDPKDYYFYLDNTPTHSYMKYLYKYPHHQFPYEQLVKENRSRGLNDPEFELLDTGIFDGNDYFDIFIEYAKASAEDILIKIKIVNHSSQAHSLYLLPTLWFRNTWSWNEGSKKPILKLIKNGNGGVIEADHPTLGKRYLYCPKPKEYLFTENETNQKRLYGVKNASAYVKDAFHHYLIQGDIHAVNRENKGTKMSSCYYLELNPGEKKEIKLRLSEEASLKNPLGAEFTETFRKRIKEADEFYKKITPFELSEEDRNIQRQAFAGMLWSKQFYHYIIEDWLKGDKNKPPKKRLSGRNHEWKHLYNDDILSMPDKWEYPWFAAWDAAFHMIPFAMIDPEFAKRQLELYTREWYMHPNGQIPAYEWNFSDVNPPVHAWAALRVFKIEKKMYGNADYMFLERVFQKLLLNFTWWVNRKDAAGRNIFEGGFLGMDNIGVFDRSSELPIGGHLHQADGTSWMAKYCLNMLAIALELTKKNMVYEDIASKFFEHFIYIARAMNNMGEEAVNLWDETAGFYFDVAHTSGRLIPFKIFSMVGLIPLFAIEVLSPKTIDRLPGFKKRMEWFINHRPELCNLISSVRTTKKEGRCVLSLVNPKKLERILQRLLNEDEFLSEFGIRTVSKRHGKHPYTFQAHGKKYYVEYAPGESNVHLFGGNSNWRGPVWFPVTYLLIESLQKFHYYLGDEFKVEVPSGSGNRMNLWEIAQLISKRLIKIFQKNAEGVRPVYRELPKFREDPEWSKYILFFEYFHGESGRGVGAQHQTGWTGLVAKLIQQCAEHKESERATVHAR